ncbi:MAG TPA: NlpC/P60 family protein [Candidatus Paceibacterota bacterium]
MDNETKTRFAMEIQRILDRSPKYVWGGSESEEKGLDCSGFLHLAARRAGLLVSRTTARNMALGRCGWDAVDVELRDMEDTDILWWTFASKPDRINGHVGTAHGHKDGWPAVVHASQSRGRVVQDPIKGWVLTDLTALRRLK